MKPLGQITVVCGSMFAGKSEELIRLVRRAMYARKKVQVFKHALDDRFALSAVATHNGVQIEAIPVRNTRELICLLDADTDVVAIEEAQFFDDDLVRLCVELADAGKMVIAAGLDQDFRRQPFGIMPQLLAVADEVIKLRAICVQCGRPASHTQRLVDGRPAAWDEPTILVGADDHYEARCRNCHQVRRAPAQHRKRLLKGVRRVQELAMKFRWSGAVAYDAEAAAERLGAYLSAIGYQAQGALRWARGNRWRAIATLSPRALPIRIEAKLQTWGAQTLVDVTYEFQRSVRALSEQDADLIVAELRGLSEYLQHGAADFERMLQLERIATRRARAAMLNTLGLMALLAIPLAWLFQQLALPPLLASTLGGAVGGLLVSYLFWWMLRR